jgi:hypothetical protein
MFADLQNGLHPSMFVGCLGLVDANGRATAIMHVDEEPTLVGLNLACFGTTIDLTSPDLLANLNGPQLVSIAPATGDTWTDFTPSLDTRMVFVSSQGNDSNDGLSQVTPVRTIARGKSLIRHGYPDWLLFRRGDVWDAPIGAWVASGRSAAEPIVIGSYGPGATRPLFRTGGASGITFTGGGSAPPTMDHVAVVGLEFYADARDPASPTYVGPGQWPSRGLQYLRPGENLLIEDCAFRMYSSNIVVEGEGSGLRGLKIRRCVLADAYGLSGVYYGHGLYMYNAHNVVIEGNVIDRNGWENGPGLQASIYTHNIYIQQLNSNVTLRRNLIARAGSHGVQLRSGGTIVDNVFVRNGISILVGGDAGTTNPNNEVIGNVVLNGSDISSTAPRGWGIDASHLPAITVRDNLIVQNNGSFQIGLNFNSVVAASVTQNTWVQWNGGNLQQSATWPGFVVDRNILSQGTAFASNRLAGAVPFEQSSRSLGAFDARIGGSGSTDNFLEGARRQSRRRWLPAYTAPAVANWMREGFRPSVDLGWPQVGAVPYR